MPKQEIPKFDSEDQEREFWGESDSADFLDWNQAKRVRLTKLKPSTKSISLRLPEGLLGDLKILANRRDVPYQSLLKIFLAERVEKELRRGQFRAQPSLVAEQPTPYESKE